MVFILIILIPLVGTLFLTADLLINKEEFLINIESKIKQMSWLVGLLIFQFLLFFLFGWGIDYASATFILVSFIAGLLIPAISYPSLIKWLNKTFLTIVALFNLWLNLLVIIIIFEEPLLTLSNLLAVPLFILACNAVTHAPLHLLALFAKLLKDESSTYQPTHKKIKKNMRDHYYKAGLDDTEIDYFRQQMAEAQSHILELEKNIQTTVKLKAIDQEHNLIATTKHYFKDIVQEPHRVASAGHFLYKLLPTIHDLTSKYNEINQHVAKNKQTYLTLNRSAEVINDLAKEITEDYLSFHKATFQAMDDNIKYAEHIMGQDDNWDNLFNDTDDNLFTNQEETHHDNEHTR